LAGVDGVGNLELKFYTFFVRVIGREYGVGDCVVGCWVGKAGYLYSLFFLGANERLAVPGRRSLVGNREGEKICCGLR
jgi:hypothetical protein